MKDENKGITMPVPTKYLTQALQLANQFTNASTEEEREDILMSCIDDLAIIQVMIEVLSRVHQQAAFGNGLLEDYRQDCEAMNDNSI